MDTPGVPTDHGVHRRLVPLEIRQQHETILGVFVAVQNALGFLFSRQDVVHPACQLVLFLSGCRTRLASSPGNSSSRNALDIRQDDLLIHLGRLVEDDVFLSRVFSDMLRTSGPDGRDLEVREVGREKVGVGREVLQSLGVALGRGEGKAQVG